MRPANGYRATVRRRRTRDEAAPSKPNLFGGAVGRDAGRVPTGETQVDRPQNGSRGRTATTAIPENANLGGSRTADLTETATPAKPKRWTPTRRLGRSDCPENGNPRKTASTGTGAAVGPDESGTSSNRHRATPENARRRTTTAALCGSIADRAANAREAPENANRRTGAIPLNAMRRTAGGTRTPGLAPDTPSAGTGTTATPEKGRRATAGERRGTTRARSVNKHRPANG